VTEALQDAKCGARRLAAVRHRHANPRASVAAHRGVITPLAGGSPCTIARYTAAHRAIGELLRQVGLRADGFCHTSKPLGPCRDGARCRPAHPGQRGRMRQQRVEKRAVRLARARVHDQACRLVDHDQLASSCTTLSGMRCACGEASSARRRLERDAFAARDGWLDPRSCRRG